MTVLVTVVGHHRGGTSATAGALRRMGVWFGNEHQLMPASPANPKGYTEHVDAVTAHDSLLRGIGMGGVAWANFAPLPAAWRSGLPYIKARSTLVDMVHQLAVESEVIGVKDPRMGRLLPLWQDVARVAGAALVPIVVRRELRAVQRSLMAREGWDAAHAWQVVSCYEAGLNDWAEVPGSAQVRYPDLLDWRRVLWPAYRLVVDLPETLPIDEAALDEFLTPELSHHG